MYKLYIFGGWKMTFWCMWNNYHNQTNKKASFPSQGYHFCLHFFLTWWQHVRHTLLANFMYAIQSFYTLVSRVLSVGNEDTLVKGYKVWLCRMKMFQRSKVQRGDDSSQRLWWKRLFCVQILPSSKMTKLQKKLSSGQKKLEVYWDVLTSLHQLKIRDDQNSRCCLIHVSIEEGAHSS